MSRSGRLQAHQWESGGAWRGPGTIAGMWISEVVHWLRSLDYGSVPAWVGLGSVLLTIRVFLRDRAVSQRSQVDSVGVWVNLSWERRAPGAPRVEEGKMEWFVRNGNQLPIDIQQIVYDIETTWWVPNRKSSPKDLDSWTPTPGKMPITFVPGPIRVPPMETFKSGEQPFSVLGREPEDADQLCMIDGLRYRLRWVLVSDAIGGRWIQVPGRRAQRVRWFTRRPREFPQTWQNPLTWRLRRLWYSLKERRVHRLQAKAKLAAKAVADRSSTPNSSKSGTG
jgi:hypothetical protein